MRRRAASAMVLAWLAACSSYSSEDAPVVPVVEAGTPTPDATTGGGDDAAPVDASDAATSSTDATASDGSDAAVDAAKPCVNTVSTGDRPPGQTNTTGAGQNWKNTGKVMNADGSSSDADLTIGQPVSQALTVSNFGFTVPTSATVVGVIVRIRGNSSEGDDDIRDEGVRLTPGGVAQGANKAAKTWHEAVETINYGGGSSPWELALTPAIVNAQAFGVAVVSKYYGTSTGTMHVDQITMSITYCQ